VANAPELATKFTISSEIATATTFVLAEFTMDLNLFNASGEGIAL
jgi:hypothetical protein